MSGNKETYYCLSRYILRNCQNGRHLYKAANLNNDIYFQEPVSHRVSTEARLKSLKVRMGDINNVAGTPQPGKFSLTAIPIKLPP